MNTLAEAKAIYFNPRTPCGVRRYEIVNTLFTDISIHAPLAGCDIG